MSALMEVTAKANIPIRTKRSLTKSSVTKRKTGPQFVAKGETIKIVDVTTLKGVKYGEMKDGLFVILERDNIVNFE